LGFARKLEAD
jgi:serine/threonine protein kinase